MYSRTGLLKIVMLFKEMKLWVCSLRNWSIFSWKAIEIRWILISLWVARSMIKCKDRTSSIFWWLRSRIRWMLWYFSSFWFSYRRFWTSDSCGNSLMNTSMNLKIRYLCFKVRTAKFTKVKQKFKIIKMKVSNLWKVTVANNLLMRKYPK